MIRLCRNTHERGIQTRTMKMPFQNTFILWFEHAYTIGPRSSQIFLRLLIPKITKIILQISPDHSPLPPHPLLQDKEVFWFFQK